MPKERIGETKKKSERRDRAISSSETENKNRAEKDTFFLAGSSTITGGLASCGILVEEPDRCISDFSGLPSAVCGAVPFYSGNGFDLEHAGPSYCKMGLFFISM